VPLSVNAVATIADGSWSCSHSPAYAFALTSAVVVLPTYANGELVLYK
jgi:hypothetical protein